MSQSDTNTKGRLANKIALVTGAAGNLGSEICRAFAREGAVVIMTGRTAERSEAARDQLIEVTGAPAERISTAVLDGADPDSVRAAVAKLKTEFGRIDILINNAGSAGPKQPLYNGRSGGCPRRNSQHLRRHLEPGAHCLTDHAGGWLDGEYLDHFQPHALLWSHRVCGAQGRA